MQTHSLGLDFVSESPFGEKDNPTMQYAYISLKKYTIDKKGNHIFITPECMSVGELDSEIDRLHEELEEIRKIARRKFAAADRRNAKISASHQKRSN